MLSQTAVGILGNFSILSHYVSRYWKKSPFKPVEVIITHLIVANFLIIVSKGILQTMELLGCSQSFSDVGCDLLLYVYRVGRSMSISTTCLLSVFQAIIIRPCSPCCKDLKVKIQRYIHLSTSLCWILYLVVHFIFPAYVLVKQNFKNITRRRVFGHCSNTSPDELTNSLYVALFVFPEVLFSGLIVWSSRSMIVLLHRHKQQVQHIRSIHNSPRVSPENRATCSILALVSTFLTFYTLSSILNAYNSLAYDPDWWLVNITSLISVSFPATGPFVLMSRETTVLRYCFIQIRKTKSPNAIISL